MQYVESEPVSEETDNLWPAESRLLDAIHRFKHCDLIDPAVSPTPAEIEGWTDESQMIRAGILRRLLLHNTTEESSVVSVRGAIITGRLDLSDASILAELSLEHCRIDTVDATRANFTEKAGFRGAAFMQEASFSEATFTQDAWFSEATFTRHASFESATFLGPAWFDRAAFTQHAWFYKATYAKDAWFYKTTFNQNAIFREATFTGHARFNEATFTQNAIFREATFTQDAWFSEARVTGDGLFRAATFARKASFDSAIVHHLNFSECIFHSAELGTFAAETVRLDNAKFRTRTRFTALCKSLHMEHTQFDEGGHLQIRGARIEFPSAEFLARTIITDPGEASFVDEFFSTPEEDVDDRLVQVPKALPDTKMSIRAISLSSPEETPDSELVQALKALRRTKASITDLRSANVTDMVLSSINLTECRFLGAHGLDTLRIDSSCDMRSSEDLPERWPMRNSRRKIIVEELNFRKPNHHTPVTPMPNTAAGNRTLQESTSAKALDIATIYRDLRRGLETSKNEPGAADFYYGEMEMRRRSTDTPWAERFLLWLYWAVSGYGLRALRAFGMVAVVIAGAGVIFSTVGIAQPSETAAITRSIDVTAEMIVDPPPEIPTVTDASMSPTEVADAPPMTTVPPVSMTRSTGVVTDPIPEPQKPSNIGDGFELAARNSVALLRNPGDRVEMTPIGTVTDIALRLLTPVLLGLGLLALRGRTKR